MQRTWAIPSQSADTTVPTSPTPIPLSDGSEMSRIFSSPEKTNHPRLGFPLPGRTYPQAGNAAGNGGRQPSWQRLDARTIGTPRIAHVPMEIVMKRLWTSPHTRATARLLLRVEALEGRELPANYLLIDFTPDAVPNERWQPASFAAAFGLRYANGTAPAFLDFNHDGYVGSYDVGPGAQAIANRVAQYFQQFDIQVWFGDVQSNTNLGMQWLNYGQQSSDEVFVMYTGGIRQDGNTNILGEAFQPAVGYVNEYYAYTYATSVVRSFMNYWPGATTSQFVDKMAQTIVHEFGHLVGLGHVYGNPAGDPNVMNYNANASNAYIPDAWYQYIQQYDNYRNEYWGWQNPAQELRASLRGEPNYANYFRGVYSHSEFSGHYQVTADEIMGDGHDEHTHDGGHHEHSCDAGDELRSDAFARRVPERRTKTFGDVDGLVAQLADTRHKRDGKWRDVPAMPRTKVGGPEALTSAPEPPSESAGARIASILGRGVRRGQRDSLNLVDTTSPDLTGLPGINLEKEESQVVIG